MFARESVARCLCLAAALCAGAGGARADSTKASQNVVPGSVRLFDTGSPSPEALSGSALGRRTGWVMLNGGDKAPVLTGDAVFLNDRVAVALRRGATGAELYSMRAAGAKFRACLRPMAGETAAGKLASPGIMHTSL